MKQLTCEMCGSNDLLKQDGVFVCQSCGTKYSVEEAKKLMIEGTVDVSGSTVKVDTSAELANLYTLARRAKDNNNSEHAQKYYDQIVVKDPSSWEANFYSVYYQAMNCTNGEIYTSASRVIKCLISVLKQIKETVKDDKEQRKAVEEVATMVITISDLLFCAQNNYYNGLSAQTKSSLANENRSTRSLISCIPQHCGDHIISNFADKYADVAVRCWKQAITLDTANLSLHPYSKDLLISEINDYIDKIKQYDSSYEPPQLPQTNTTQTGGCYVATAVYGSYDCPQVWTLRRYRDYTLAETWYGRAFIRTYYAISPTLVKWFGHTDWFKNMWKGTLDRMVADLNADGVEDSPYEDKIW